MDGKPKHVVSLESGDDMAMTDKKKKVKSRPFRRVDRKSLEARIESLDQEMQRAIEKGEFDVARKLAEEQEKLLEYLMLLNDKF
jgi:excinuclease UvrABC helicase subunit UvrB